MLDPKAMLLKEAENPCEMKTQATQLSITYNVMCLGFLEQELFATAAPLPQRTFMLLLVAELVELMALSLA